MAATTAADGKQSSSSARSSILENLGCRFTPGHTSAQSCNSLIIIDCPKVSQQNPWLYLLQDYQAFPAMEIHPENQYPKPEVQVQFPKDSTRCISGFFERKPCLVLKLAPQTYAGTRCSTSGADRHADRQRKR